MEKEELSKNQIELLSILEQLPDSKFEGIRAYAIQLLKEEGKYE